MFLTCGDCNELRYDERNELYYCAAYDQEVSPDDSADWCGRRNISYESTSPREKLERENRL